jgi:hypothetical protein
MPRISVFYGIAIYMYFRDHAPPHFHAQYAGDEAVIAIADGRVIRGEIPDRALRLVREWLEAHRRELDENWRLASEPAPLHKIDPLP